MSGSWLVAIPVLLGFVVIPLSSGIIFFYFVRRYVRRKLERKDLGLKYNLIVSIISLIVIIIVFVLFAMPSRVL